MTALRDKLRTLRSYLGALREDDIGPEDVERPLSEVIDLLKDAVTDTERLDWVLSHRNYRVQGSDEHGWCVLDCRNGLTFLVDHQPTARAAIDAAKALTKEK